MRSQKRVGYVSRRKVLGSLGLGAISVAGCVGDEGDDDADAPGDDTEDTDDDTSPFPEDDITLVVPFSTGGGFDTYARLVADHLPKYLDADIRVENMEGAAGQVAMEHVYAQEGDPYTNMIMSATGAGRVQLLEDPDFDITEMTYLPQVEEAFQGIIVREDAGIDSLDTFVDGVQNEEYNFGATGLTTAGTVNLAVLGELTGLYSADKILDNVVIYDGTSEIVVGMQSGDVDTLAGSYYSILPQIDQEGIEMFMVMYDDEEPPEETPDALTLGGEGIDNAQQIHNMVAVRRIFGAPPEITDEETEILRNAYSSVIDDDEEFLQDAEDAGRPVVYLSSEEAEEAMAEFIDLWEEHIYLLEG